MKKEEGISVRNTPVFKLKDKPRRQFQVINLVETFGFVPEVIIIEKIKDHTNTFIVRAILTEKEIEKESISRRH